MLTQEKAQTLLGSRAFDAQGDELGTVEAIYVDDQTDKPEFAVVVTPEGARPLVPLARAEESEGSLRLACTQEAVAGSPPIDPGEGLTQQEEARLYSHYGIDYTVTVVDGDEVRLHRRAGESDVTAAVEEHHEVLVEREPLDGEDA